MITETGGSIRELVRQARQRFFVNVAVAQAVLALSVGVAGVVLILIFGAQLLDWRWLAALAVLTFPLAFFRTARGIPSPYRVAQIVDARLDLNDSISTALYFADHSDAVRGSAAMRQAQLIESERIVQQVDPKIAIPIATPRLVLFGSLVLTAAVLFGVRYGLLHRLDLSRPLTSILIDTFGDGSEKIASAKKTKRSPLDVWKQMTEDAAAGPDAQFQGGGEEKGPMSPENMTDAALKQPGAADADSKGDGSKESDGKKASGDNPGEPSDQAASEKSAANGKEGDSMPGSKEGENPGGKQPSNSSESSSLASKLKEAMSNLLNSMKSKDGSNSQPSPGKGGADSKSQQQAKAGQKSQGEGEKKSGDGDSSDAEDGQQGDTEGGKPGEGKGSSQTADGQPGNNSGGGAGKQEGSKAAKLAEQMAAMGKISEIIGKRSANVTGEVTIEVTSSKQPIKTPYAEGKAPHAEAGGEINRDEVPAAFQEYVQQYFEQVRKPAAVAGKKAASPAPQQ